LVEEDEEVVVDELLLLSLDLDFDFLAVAFADAVDYHFSPALDH
jgi:hypothetical protein